MYISEIKIWNFRKYGGNDFDLTKPHITVPLKKGMNVLVGENDSGKTAIIDAIKYVLKTNAYETIRIYDDDFYNESTRLRIEVLIDEMSDSEASVFCERTIPVEGKDFCRIRLILDVTRKYGRISNYEVCAGADEYGHPLSADMRANLRATYLKPLRDAENELTAKKNSRLSQILQSHKLLQEKDGEEPHEFIKIIEDANQKIEEWFKDETDGNASHKRQIKDVIDDFLKMFIASNSESRIFLAEPTMRNILERISISLLSGNNWGLGSLNRLFMATELLHLKKEGEHLRVCLIEELEAHIHPQAQMKVVTGLQKENNVQIILTTHSSNITSKVKLGDNSGQNNLLICKGNKVFPMGPEYTRLEKKDYVYLDHFLDVTKSNLFFAKGVLLVEGWAEEILLPIIASKIGIDLTQKEVSIVNVGSTAYLHFARIFMRNTGDEMDVRCAIVTDLDINPDEENKEELEEKKIKSIDDRLGILPTNVKYFIAKEWTLEWCLFKSEILSELFKDSVACVHSKTNEFKKDNKTQAYKDSFEKKLKEKLKSKLDKVAIAQELAIRIEKDENINLTMPDEYIKYLIDAIKFAVRI